MPPRLPPYIICQPGHPHPHPIPDDEIVLYAQDFQQETYVNAPDLRMPPQRYPDQFHGQPGTAPYFSPRLAPLQRGPPPHRLRPPNVHGDHLIVEDRQGYPNCPMPFGPMVRHNSQTPPHSNGSQPPPTLNPAPLAWPAAILGDYNPPPTLNPAPPAWPAASPVDYNPGEYPAIYQYGIPSPRTRPFVAENAAPQTRTLVADDASESCFPPGFAIHREGTPDRNQEDRDASQGAPLRPAEDPRAPYPRQPSQEGPPRSVRNNRLVGDPEPSNRGRVPGSRDQQWPEASGVPHRPPDLSRPSTDRLRGDSSVPRPRSPAGSHQAAPHWVDSRSAPPGSSLGAATDKTSARQPADQREASQGRSSRRGSKSRSRSPAGGRQHFKKPPFSSQAAKGRLDRLHRSRSPGRHHSSHGGRARGSRSRSRSPTRRSAHRSQRSRSPVRSHPSSRTSPRRRGLSPRRSRSPRRERDGRGEDVQRREPVRMRDDRGARERGPRSAGPASSKAGSDPMETDAGWGKDLDPDLFWAEEDGAAERDANAAAADDAQFQGQAWAAGGGLGVGPRPGSGMDSWLSEGAGGPSKAEQLASQSGQHDVNVIDPYVLSLFHERRAAAGMGAAGPDGRHLSPLQLQTSEMEAISLLANLPPALLAQLALSQASLPPLSGGFQQAQGQQRPEMSSLVAGAAPFQSEVSVPQAHLSVNLRPKPTFPRVSLPGLSLDEDVDSPRDSAGGEMRACLRLLLVRLCEAMIQRAGGQEPVPAEYGLPLKCLTQEYDGAFGHWTKAPLRFEVACPGSHTLREAVERVGEGVAYVRLIPTLKIQEGVQPPVGGDPAAVPASVVVSEIVVLPVMGLSATLHQHLSDAISQCQPHRDKRRRLEEAKRAAEAMKVSNISPAAAVPLGQIEEVVIPESGGRSRSHVTLGRTSSTRPVLGHGPSTSDVGLSMPPQKVIARLKGLLRLMFIEEGRKLNGKLDDVFITVEAVRLRFDAALRGQCKSEEATAGLGYHTWVALLRGTMRDVAEVEDDVCVNDQGQPEAVVRPSGMFLNEPCTRPDFLVGLHGSSGPVTEPEKAAVAVPQVFQDPEGGAPQAGWRDEPAAPAARGGDDGRDECPHTTSVYAEY